MGVIEEVQKEVEKRKPKTLALKYSGVHFAQEYDRKKRQVKRKYFDLLQFIDLDKNEIIYKCELTRYSSYGYSSLEPWIKIMKDLGYSLCEKFIEYDSKTVVMKKEEEE